MITDFSKVYEDKVIEEKYLQEIKSAETIEEGVTVSHHSMTPDKLASVHKSILRNSGHTIDSHIHSGDKHKIVSTNKSGKTLVHSIVPNGAGKSTMTVRPAK